MEEKISKTVDKALHILDVIAEKKIIGINELARHVGLDAATVYRLVTTLSKNGYVKQNRDSKKYQLGFKLVTLGNRMMESLEIREVARPFLESLRDKVNETIHLMVIENYEGIYIDKIETTQTVRMVTSRGRVELLHCSSVGKAIMAYLSEDDVKEIIRIKGLPQMTENTINNEHDLFNDLKKIRGRGYSIDNNEGEEGIVCVGAAIFDYNGNAIAGISIACPAYRVSDNIIGQLGIEVQNTAKAISRSLGFISQNKLNQD